MKETELEEKSKIYNELDTAHQELRSAHESQYGESQEMKKELMTVRNKLEQSQQGQKNILSALLPLLGFNTTMALGEPKTDFAAMLEIKDDDASMTGNGNISQQIDISWDISIIESQSLAKHAADDNLPRKLRLLRCFEPLNFAGALEIIERIIQYLPQYVRLWSI